MDRDHLEKLMHLNCIPGQEKEIEIHLTSGPVKVISLAQQATELLEVRAGFFPTLYTLAGLKRRSQVIVLPILE